MIYKQLGSTKTKRGLTHSPVYYPFASTHTVNTQLLRVQNVHTKYCEFIFLWVFEFALADFCTKLAKINATQILPLLKYTFYNLFRWQKNMKILAQNWTQDSHMKRYIFLSTEFAEKAITWRCPVRHNQILQTFFQSGSPYIKRNYFVVLL